MKTRLSAWIKNKTITFPNEGYARQHLQDFEGKKIYVTVETKSSRRTLSQNSLMWMWFEIISKHTGHTSEEIHVIVKGLYCPKKEVTLKDKRYFIPRGTSDLSSVEMTELMMRVQSMAGDLGITLPSPDDYWKQVDKVELLTD